MRHRLPESKWIRRRSLQWTGSHIRWTLQQHQLSSVAMIADERPPVEVSKSPAHRSHRRAEICLNRTVAGPVSLLAVELFESIV